MNLTSNGENVVKLELEWLSYLIFHFYFFADCLGSRFIFRNTADAKVKTVICPRDSICVVSRLDGPLSCIGRKVCMCKCVSDKRSIATCVRERRVEQRISVPSSNSAGCVCNLYSGE